MNRSALKNYAPQARRDFIQAITNRAAFYGLTADKIEPVTEGSDVAVIAGREHPRAIARKRKQLEERIKEHGFDQTMEALAYTWFNRLVAIRFMEIHGYLDHGYRILSHPEGKSTPEILEHAEHVQFTGLKKDTVVDLKLAGNKDEVLYRLLLTAQCNALHTAMPFLFERIDDDTELLLPDNLLHSDSLIRKLVNEIDEGDWQQVEIIGWIYQFYISEKKDEVIGKVVASEDIPAATQLFTPNWIVKYLVQNTLGRQWLATYPGSALRQQMNYYIEPAEQTPEVHEQLKAITHSSLNPEELTLLDPACGSGHILVEAYDLFKAIYQERGYRAKDIPALILQKNLFGLEIDNRAAQLASFALMMKARADDRRIFDSCAKPNILAFEDSQGMNATDIAHALNAPINEDDVPSEYLFEEIQEDKDGLFSKKALAEKGHVSQADVVSLLALFENAKTFGSLIQVPPKLVTVLQTVKQRLDEVLEHGSLIHTPAHILQPFFQQAQLLAKKYDVVVTNPPYMNNGYFERHLKQFVAYNYPSGKSDLYGCFILRSQLLCADCGMVGMITIPNWMFLSGFEALREGLVDSATIESLVHNGRGVWGSDFGSCSFVVRNKAIPAFRAKYKRLFEVQGSVSTLDELENKFFVVQPYINCMSDFKSIPGIPIAYWMSDKKKSLFKMMPPLGDYTFSEGPCKTGNDAIYLRSFWEISAPKMSAVDGWSMCSKGGASRKYFGNIEHVILWTEQARQHYRNDSISRISAESVWDRQGITWSIVTAKAASSFRILPKGCKFNSVSPTIFLKKCSDDVFLNIVGLLNSRIAEDLLGLLNPTLAMNVGNVLSLPVASEALAVDPGATRELLGIYKDDWDSNEYSADFLRLPFIAPPVGGMTFEQSWKHWESLCGEKIHRAQVLESENNRRFISIYGLQAELSSEVPNSEIGLARANRNNDCQRLISFAFGCIMGRYSLDTPGLVYAACGDRGFDQSEYKTFRANDDGIIPLIETDWGIRNDAANRLFEFIGVAWPKEYLEQSLKFVADSLGPASNEQPRKTIRRYLTTGFYRHHLSMYKRRPIYWLFSSGKQRAFQCLVYLHRYHEGTLARMRTDYVIPLQGQIAARIEQLEADKAKATSTSHRNKLQKEQTDLKKQEAELLIFEEKLRHAADQKITLDLDDGVKVNYAKFGDLLAESKAITGGKDDE